VVRCLWRRTSATRRDPDAGCCCRRCDCGYHCSLHSAHPVGFVERDRLHRAGASPPLHRLGTRRRGCGQRLERARVDLSCAQGSLAANPSPWHAVAELAGVWPIARVLAAARISTWRRRRCLLTLARRRVAVRGRLRVGIRRLRVGIRRLRAGIRRWLRRRRGRVWLRVGIRRRAAIGLRGGRRRRCWRVTGRRCLALLRCCRAMRYVLRCWRSTAARGQAERGYGRRRREPDRNDLETAAIDHHTAPPNLTV
jgi:hypothetical protein